MPGIEQPVMIVRLVNRVRTSHYATCALPEECIGADMAPHKVAEPDLGYGIASKHDHF